MIKIRQSGVWKEVQHIYVKSGGAWKEAVSVFNKKDGVWTKSHNKVFFVKIVLNTDTTNFNLLTACTAAGWDGVKTLDVELSISPGVSVYATTTGVYALTMIGLRSDDKVKLINFGNIIGKGGAGGAASSAGQPGGPALYIPTGLVSIENWGTIGGGGGGGGGSPNYRVITTVNKSDTCTNYAGSPGGKGEDTTAAGTRGGSLGTAGAYGGNAQNCANGTTYGGNGGAGGNCIVGSSFITWIRTGTRAGALV